jgi:hypothetical protein
MNNSIPSLESLETNVPAIVETNVPSIVETNVPQYTKVDEWAPLVIAKLTDIFGEKTDRLFALLRETESLISGGQILSACSPFTTDKIQDTDIYVPVKHIPTFLKAFMKDEDSIYKPAYFKTYGSSFYCKSFLRKNGIRRVFKFQGRNKSEVDIMAVRNKRTPLAVVNNFDLTFCQVWFDGTNVYASHPDDIRNKNGHLQNDYCMTLINGNRFLKERINKYVQRGFNISFDPKFCNSALKNINAFACRYDNSSGCTPNIPVNYELDSEYVKKWFNRIALRWMANDRDLNEGKNLAIPLKIDSYERFNQENKFNDNAKGNAYISDGIINDFKIKNSDGYDTEDMDENSLKQIAVKFYNEEPRPSDDLIFYRAMTNLVKNSKMSYKDFNRQFPHYNITFADFVDAPYKYDDNIGLKARLYLDILEMSSLRDGDDIFGNEGKLYDIHSHDIEGGITKESLETYLSNTLNGSAYDVRCYYAGQGCDKMLTLQEIKGMVSTDFYRMYSAPRIVKSGLNTDIDNYEVVFRNTKSLDNTYGNIYHATMCPYCLKFDERGEGCSVMTHENPEGLPHESAPFCPNKKSVDSIRQKYLNAAVNLTGGFYHLEFCVECGRPCSGHQHFKLDLSAMENLRLIPSVSNPATLVPDYGVCTGGGRVEMIARMLAVRDIYNRTDINNSVEERRLAAEAADVAPLNPELMARAQAIWDKAPADRKWNVEVPKKKRYSNIPVENNDSVNNNDSIEPNENNQEGGSKNIVTLNELRKLRSLNRQTRRSRR